MPIGSKLAEDIEHHLGAELRSGLGSDAGPITRAIMGSGGFGPHHAAAMRRIHEGIGTKESIDEFIEEWSDIDSIRDVARLCIAHRILAGEQGTILSDVNIRDGGAPLRIRQMRNSWIGLLIRHMNPGISRRQPEVIFDECRFVTFNYDRCIERYLYTYLTSSLAIDPPEAAKTVDAIGVHHIYGHLGPIHRPDRAVPFGADDFHLASAARSIRTYGEQIQDPNFAAIQREIYGADRIVFLGCAFHDQNLKLLFPNGPPPGARIWATTLGLRPVAEARVASYFGDRPGFRRLEATQCGELLDRFQEEIFS